MKIDPNFKDIVECFEEREEPSLTQILSLTQLIVMLLYESQGTDQLKWEIGTLCPSIRAICCSTTLIRFTFFFFTANVNGRKDLHHEPEIRLYILYLYQRLQGTRLGQLVLSLFS